MNDKFDDLAKGMAQSVTRRRALKKFGVALAGMALATLGLAERTNAAQRHCKADFEKCRGDSDCCSGFCDHGAEPKRFGLCRPYLNHQFDEL